jgi:transcription elongation factor Elf1
VRELAWRTDEPCPVCETGLTVVDSGLMVLRAECRLCGYVTAWDSADDATGGDW